uniref:Uncharacterized protein n=1 Tax=Candidatus Methanogaster sp. ANME-2c ERB4 TaxID=2759911 RepID=A0A7G9YME8_9EURY|nr:hypothetical protein CDCKMDEO_00027 [Methanosarcinales archaeon ANME-2c ERB4]
MKEQAKEKVNKLVERFRYKWIKYKYWIYCIILTSAVISIIYYVHPNECPENARYILSAISQGLAAILALVFTITLVVAQMTRRYTAMDKIIFRRETKFLMIFFGIGIIAPLLVLEFGFWKWGVPLSIAIASFCVFSLLPFLKGVNSVLKYDIGIVNLDEEIMEAIELGRKPRLSKIRELNEVGESAIKESREDVISLISRVLSRVGMKSAEKKLWYVTLQVVYALKNIGLKSVENGFKYNSTRGIVDGLKFIARKTLKEIEVSGDFKDAVIVEVLKGLSDIGVKAAEKGLEAIIKDVAGHLTYVGRESGNKEALIGLWCLGAAVTKYIPGYVVEVIVIRNIKELEEIISGDWLQLAERCCMDYYPDLDLKDAFEEFKRINNR